MWYDQTDTGGRAAFDSIDAQLDTINTHVSALNDQFSASNASITATTNAIIAQLDAVRLAASGLKETPTKTVDDVSDSEEDSSGSGRVVSCGNEAAVSGDANVGGIAGIMALELDPGPGGGPGSGRREAAGGHHSGHPGHSAGLPQRRRRHCQE